MKEITWDKISHFKNPEQSPGFLLWQASTNWRRSISNALSEIGLTHPQFVILACLSWMGRNQKKVSQVQLARFCKTDITMTSQIIRTLEKKRYIVRKSDDSDERKKFPVVTENGARLIEEAIPLVEQVDEQFFRRLEGDVELCVRILQRLASNKLNEIVSSAFHTDCYYNRPSSSGNEELRPFSNAAKSLVEGGIYEHYKGRQYKVISVGRNSETLEEIVIYQALYGAQDVWSRPLRMFLENVVLNGQAVPRFKQVLRAHE